MSTNATLKEAPLIALLHCPEEHTVQPILKLPEPVEIHAGTVERAVHD
jgi:hypothetical protein